jgi:hypothetical protein
MSDMTSIALSVVTAVFAVVYGAAVPFIVYRQHTLIRQLTQMLAARSLGEWANVQKKLERPEPKPDAEGADW